jgi:TolA-binding protein
MRKEDVREDQFQSLVTKVIKAYYRSPRNFQIGAGVVVVAIAAAIILLSNKPKPDPQPNILFDEAVLLLSDQQRPDTASAEQILTELTRRYPGHALGLRGSYYQGCIYFQQRKFDEARRAFDKFAAGVKNDPLLTPAAHMGIGNCYEETGDLSRAADAYAGAYRSNPKWTLADQAVLAAGRCYTQKNRLSAAADLYDQYIRANPKAAPDVLNEVKIQLAYVRTLAGNK